jgi:hypothetical protein
VTAFSIYQASIPVYVRQLKALSSILAKAATYAAQRKIEPAALINARLYPDMLPLARQVQSACNHARRGAARLSGAEPERVEDKENSFEELQALVEKTLAGLTQIDSAKVDAMAGRDITYPAGDRKVTMPAGDYLLHFSMPNFYFHVTTAYAILRHNGLEIGKDDFMGQK